MNLWETSETSSIQSRLQGPMQAGPWIQIVLCAVELNVAESCWTNEIHLFRYYSLFGPLGRCGEFARGKGFLEWAFGIAQWLCLDGPVRTLLHDIILSSGWDDQLWTPERNFKNSLEFWLGAMCFYILHVNSWTRFCCEQFQGEAQFSRTAWHLRVGRLVKTLLEFQSFNEFQYCQVVPSKMIS